MNKHVLKGIIIGIVVLIGIYTGYCSYVVATQPIFITKPRTGIVTYKDTMLSTGKYVRQRNILVVDYNGIKEDEDVSLATYSSFNVGDKITLSQRVVNIDFTTFLLGLLGLIAIATFIGGMIFTFISWVFE